MTEYHGFNVLLFPFGVSALTVAKMFSKPLGSSVLKTLLYC